MALARPTLLTTECPNRCSHGKAQVKWVPCAAAAGLKHLGALAAASPELLASQLDAAFAAAVDQQVAELFNS